jgi:dTDP-4-amino-4,6-dideoxygalactose transaminase
MEVRNIRLSKSVIGQEEIDAVTDVLRDEYLGMGKYVQKFEAELTGFFQRDATLVNTGTAALHLALQCAGISAGDEVLVQSLTYVACFQAIQATGAKPIACEVMPETLTIDIEDAAQKVNSRTKAIMPVHYAGNVGDLDGVYEFARKHDLRIIEDASHAFGTIYKGKLVGSFGDICCFSFDGIKNITSGEGGVIITDDPKVQKLLKDARLLSVENDTESRFRGTRTWDFDVKYQGWRYHMSNIMAAIGSAQLAKFSVFKQKRQSLAKLYQKELGDHVNLVKCDYNEVVPHIMVIMADPAKRDHLKVLLREHGIATGMHYKPNHLLTMFCGNQDNSTLKRTESIYAQLITLPLHPDLSKDDVMFICRMIREAL